MPSAHLRQAGGLDVGNVGLVLTGGGSRLNGLAQMCEEIVKRPVRLASPSSIAEMPPQLAEPEFAPVVGLAMYAHRTTVSKVTELQGFGHKLRALFAKLGA